MATVTKIMTEKKAMQVFFFRMNISGRIKIKSKQTVIDGVGIYTVILRDIIKIQEIFVTVCMLLKYGCIKLLGWSKCVDKKLIFNICMKNNKIIQVYKWIIYLVPYSHGRLAVVDLQVFPATAA